jgi:hypothetical protein
MPVDLSLLVPQIFSTSGQRPGRDAGRASLRITRSPSAIRLTVKREG